MEKIGIIGCGWLGLPLALELVKRYEVVGTTTSPNKLDDLRNSGIQPVLLEITPDQDIQLDSRLEGCTTLIINIPPGRRDPDAAETYPLKIQRLVKAFSNSKLRHIIFASSTGVYSKDGGKVDESTEPKPDTKSGVAVKKAESVVMESGLPYTILRLAGLAGGSRQPGRWFADKENVKGGDTKINMVHRDDCIAIVHKILHSDKRNEVYNVCADLHPDKKRFYTAQSKMIRERPATWLKGITGNKSVSNQKLKAHLGYEYIYPDPLLFS